MIITSEYVYDNIELNKTRNFLHNNIEEYQKEYGFSNNRVVKVKYNAEFYDKIKNERKIFTIDRYNMIGELNQIMQKSREEIKPNKILEVKIIIQGRLNKNIKDM